MVFSVSDSFTTLGATKLYGCWTPDVTKFDASSFYNWEQDNLPAYDLEERTHFLWEKAGYAPSTVNGLTFVVSSQAPNSLIGCNTNVFQSVSAAVRALPEVIRFPVVVEIASFGNLGELNLNGIQFTENGSLEIINRNAMKCNAGSALNYLDGTYYYTVIADRNTTNIFSAYKYPDVIQSYDIRDNFTAASAISISSTIFSAAPSVDVRKSTGTHGFLMVPGYSDSYPSLQMMPYDRLYGMLDSATFYVTSYAADYTNKWTDFGQFNSSETTPFDASCIDYVAGTEVIVPQRDAEITVGAVYNNYFEKIRIKNCNGPIYIRNLFAHGQLIREHGFDIENCNLVLDNCGAARFTKTGFNVVNSNIILTRGIYAYRNYGVATTGNGATRLTGSYQSFVKNEGNERLDSAAGFKATNSNLIFSATSEWESQINAGFFGSNPRNVSGCHFAIAFDRNYNGLHLINSNVRGLKPRSESNVFAVRDTGYLGASNNVNAGILAENSKIFWDGRILASNNTKGIDLHESNLDTDDLIIRGNQRVGVKATNSEIWYNKNKYPNAIRLEETALVSYFSMWFKENGQHLILDNSILDVVDTSALDAKFGTFRLNDNFWLNTNSTNISGVGQSPAVELRNGSYARILGIYADRSLSKFLIDDPERGSIIAALEGSKAVLQSSKLVPGYILGNYLTASLARRKYNAAIYAGNNSEVAIQGPHLIRDFGVNLLAENNSKILISPHLTRSGNLDISGFTLSDTGNHTTVELKSQRSCIVVDKNSVLDVQNLGDYRECWSRGALGTLVLTSGCDYDTRQTSGYTYRGSLQFYPSPVESTYAEILPPVGDSPTIVFYFTDGGSTSNRNYFLTDDIFDPNTANAVSAVTLGGWCVRVLGNSVAKVTNVNFPAGWWNPSGVIFDSSGVNNDNDLCDKLFMWNIADGSELITSYVSVSGLFPQDAGYFGPSSVWGSGTNSIAYGAPAGTPDTSSLSVLDWFGGVALSALPRPTGATPRFNFGFSPPENKGPFRLYVHTDPVASFLATTNSTNSFGYANQLFAQGYNFSGNMYAPSSVSGLTASLTRWDGSNLITSGFYYCSAFTPNSGHRILLDESAANLFANAKNGSAARSGRSQICTIFLPYTNTDIGNSSTSKRYGRGLQSLQVFDLDKDN